MKLAATGILLAASAIWTIAIWQTLAPQNSKPPTFSLADASPSPMEESNLILLASPIPVLTNMPQWRFNNPDSKPRELHPVRKPALAPGIYETHPCAGIVLVPYWSGNADVQHETSPRDSLVKKPNLDFMLIAPLPKSMTNAVPE